MPANKNLIKVIAGRMISTTVPAEGTLELTLDDGSVLAIKHGTGNSEHRY